MPCQIHTEPPKWADGKLEEHHGKRKKNALSCMECLGVVGGSNNSSESYNQITLYTYGYPSHCIRYKISHKRKEFVQFEHITADCVLMITRIEHDGTYTIRTCFHMHKIFKKEDSDEVEQRSYLSLDEAVNGRVREIEEEGPNYGYDIQIFATEDQEDVCLRS